jgi:hypothetical protein
MAAGEGTRPTLNILPRRRYNCTGRPISMICVGKIW